MRADRLIAIVMHLQSKGKMTAKELAALLEVSERTIYRDIDALGSAGVPIVADSGLGGGFSLSPGYRTNVDGLHKDEIHALFLQLDERPFRQLGIGQSLQSALLKIFHSLPGQLRHDAEWIQNRVYLDTRSWRPRPDDTKFMRQLQRSVWEELQVNLLYRDRTGTDYRWAADPFGLVLKSGMWFLVVRTEQGLVSLRVARIREFELTDRKFERPADFNLEAYWGVWTTDYERKAAPYEVRMRADTVALAALSAMSEASVDETSIRETEEGRSSVRVLFPSEEIALTFAAGWAAHVEALAPQELRVRLAERAALLREQYGEQNF
ncbi:helix-turn-helix transcriptional regulator [Cohnella zeiphila]|uniref:YafY family transcriptional regulator n=1 Tax=Cohnella zeiphila TaxID=2761120 RepID=A0A7X0SXF5_9BACL|nr:YafY family protein [Cohnella zeiphila]MBB6735693.1 YafY family transcriptional regulator [Cohnella zeiphila]